LRYWQGYRLEIHRLWVPVLAGHHCIVTLGKLRTVHLCASITKQYNLLLAKGMISLAGKVTAVYHRVHS